MSVQGAPAPEVGLEGLVSYEEALNRVLELVAALPPLPDETAPLEEAAGRVLANDVATPEAFPPLARASMDGFAVRSSDVAGAGPDTPRPLKLAGTLTAGAGQRLTVEAGRCVRIMTGVPMPDGSDAVVPQELARLDGDTVWVQRAVQPGAFTFPAGEDASAGEVVTAAGSCLTPGQISMLAAIGVTRVRVRVRPVVALAATGDEVVSADRAELLPGQVRNSNAYGVAAQLRTWGARPLLFGIVPDDPSELERAAREMASAAAALVFTGGMSVGMKDLVRPTLERLGVRWVVHRVAIRPGRPFCFGLWAGKPVFGLPGTPAGAMVSAELFIRPFLAAWLGRQWQPPECVGRLSGSLRMTPGRMRLVRARAWVGPDGQMAAEPLPVQSSASVRSMADANAILMIPPDASELPSGAAVRIRLFQDLLP